MHEVTTTLSKTQLAHRVHCSNCCRVFPALPDERREQPSAAFRAMQCASANDPKSPDSEAFTGHVRVRGQTDYTVQT